MVSQIYYMIQCSKEVGHDDNFLVTKVCNILCWVRERETTPIHSLSISTRGTPPPFTSNTNLIYENPTMLVKHELPNAIILFLSRLSTILLLSNIRMQCIYSSLKDHKCVQYTSCWVRKRWCELGVELNETLNLWTHMSTQSCWMIPWWESFHLQCLNNLSFVYYLLCTTFGVFALSPSIYLPQHASQLNNLHITKRVQYLMLKWKTRKTIPTEYECEWGMLHSKTWTELICESDHAQH